MSFYSLKCYRRFSHTTVVVEVLLLRHQPSDCQDVPTHPSFLRVPTQYPLCFSMPPLRLLQFVLSRYSMTWNGKGAVLLSWQHLPLALMAAPSPCSHGSTFPLLSWQHLPLALMAAPSPCSHGSTFPLLSWQYLPLALMAAPSPLLSWQHLPLALMAAQHLPLALMAAPSPCSHGSTFPFALMAAPSPCSHGSTFPVFSLACRAAYKFQGSKAQLNIGLSEEEKRELDAESEEDFVTSIRNLLLARHRGSSRPIPPCPYPPSLCPITSDLPPPPLPPVVRSCAPAEHIHDCTLSALRIPRKAKALSFAWDVLWKVDLCGAREYFPSTEEISNTILQKEHVEVHLLDGRSFVQPYSYFTMVDELRGPMARRLQQDNYATSGFCKVEGSVAAQHYLWISNSRFVADIVRSHESRAEKTPETPVLLMFRKKEFPKDEIIYDDILADHSYIQEPLFTPHPMNFLPGPSAPPLLSPPPLYHLLWTLSNLSDKEHSNL
ncbi:unnamed protein product [Closterium sp. NIES-65]|nr:unnamed protein product [Closterium sp. NIES-65]